MVVAWPGLCSECKFLYILATACSQDQILGSECYRYFRRNPTRRYYYQTNDINGDAHASNYEKAQDFCRSLPGGGNLPNPTSKKQVDFMLALVPAEE